MRTLNESKNNGSGDELTAGNLFLRAGGGLSTKKALTILTDQGFLEIQVCGCRRLWQNASRFSRKLSTGGCFGFFVFGGFSCSGLSSGLSDFSGRVLAFAQPVKVLADRFDNFVA